jgi:hypothetical protein
MTSALTTDGPLARQVDGVFDRSAAAVTCVVHGGACGRPPATPTASPAPGSRSTRSEPHTRQA